MRFAALCACAGLALAGPAWAVDYDKLDRKLTKEPAYRTGKPRYALILFGPEARLEVWAVLDGETLYLDRNGDGDLTAPDERFAKEADCQGVELADPDGVTRYRIRRLATDRSFRERWNREVKRAAPQMMVYVTVTGPRAFKQYCDVAEMRTDPKVAMVAHFNGPLTIGPRTMGYQLPPWMDLETGDKPGHVHIIVGTMSQQHGCWVVSETHDDKNQSLFPQGVFPVAEVEFPAATAGAAPIRERYELQEFC